MNQTQLGLPGFSPNLEQNATSSADGSSSPVSEKLPLRSKLANVWRAIRPWFQIVGVIVSVLSALYITIVTTTTESKTVEQIRAELVVERREIADHNQRISKLQSSMELLWPSMNDMSRDIGQIKTELGTAKGSLDEVKTNVRLLVQHALH